MNEDTSVPVTYRTFTSYPIGAYDGYSALPIKLGLPATTTEIVPPELVFDHDRIVDEISTDRRIKSCDHSKIRVDQVKPVLHADSGYGTSPQQTYPPKRTVSYMWRGVLLSRKPHYAAWKALGPGSLLGLSSIPANDGALLSALGTKVPPDRLGELPARLVAAIEEWQLLTSVAEAEDYARLMDFAKARGPLRASGTAVNNWLRSRNDFSRRYRGSTTRKTLWNLGSAYRSGQLGYSFGIMPTVSEVRTISEMLMEGVKANQTRITRTLRGQNQVLNKYTYPSELALCGRPRRTEKVEILRVDGVTANLKRPRIQNASMRNMLNRLVGVSGARLIWDFLPGSFVVDWFLSVDDALDTLWLGSQTEYDIDFWSSTKLLYTRDVMPEFLSIQDFYPESKRIFVSASPLRGEYTHYTRTPRVPPSLIDSLRFRMGPKQGFLTVLLGLGLVPRSLTRKLKSKLT